MGSRGRSCPGCFNISGERSHALWQQALYVRDCVPSACADSLCWRNFTGLYISRRAFVWKSKVVDVFADFNVEIVDALCDLDVKFVDALPNQCGEWEFVDTFEDFSVKFVDVFGDFSICNVDALPGLR